MYIRQSTQKVQQNIYKNNHVDITVSQCLILLY